MTLLCPLLLAACATTQPFVATAPRQVPLADSMIMLFPGAGAQQSVVQTVYGNAIEQTVSLETTSRTPGQNYITVQFFKTNAVSATPGGLQDVPLANLDLAGEARGTVSYADMKLSPYFVQNSYGPFGYSMGRTATGDICMYAWQRVPAPRVSTGSDWKTVNVRALICASDSTEQDLLQVLLQLHLKGVAGKGRPAPAEIGAYGAIVSPFDSGPANVLPVVVTTPSTPRAAVTPAVIADAPGPVPAPPGSAAGTGTTVPPPPGGATPQPTSTPVPVVPPPN